MSPQGVDEKRGGQAVVKELGYLNEQLRLRYAGAFEPRNVSTFASPEHAPSHLTECNY